jgi:hypothetical protein
VFAAGGDALVVALLSTEVVAYDIFGGSLIVVQPHQISGIRAVRGMRGRILQFMR